VDRVDAVAAQSELGRLHKRAIDAGGDERCARAVAELSEYVLSLSAFRALVEGKIAEYVLS
jgi:hypothetical protein